MATYGFTINVDGNSVQAMKQIESSLSNMGITAKVETEKVEHAFHGMGEKIKGVISEYKSLIFGGLAVGGIFGGIEFIKGSIEAYDKLEKAVTRVNTVIQSTHGAAGYSANAIEEQAAVLSKSILQGRSEIMDAQGMLLSFTGIKGPVFGQATKAVADFATFYKTDMTSAALAIGKALNDPAKGMNRLQRMGVMFTDEQKKQVKLYEQQGKLASAQGVILKELKTEFGGQAVAAAGTDEGKIEMAKKQWADLQITIGEIFSKIQVSLIPAFSSFVKYVKEAFNSAPVQFFLEHLNDLVSVALKLIPIWAGYKLVMMAINGVKTAYTAITRMLTPVIMEEAAVTNNATAAAVNMARAQGGAAAALAEEAAAAATAAGATETTAVATTGLSSAIGSIGIGALIVGLGLIIEKFIEWNNEIDESVEGLTQIKDIKSEFKTSERAVEKISLAMEGATSKPQKSGVLADINTKIKEIQDKIDLEVKPALNKSIGDVDRLRGYKDKNSTWEYAKGMFKSLAGDQTGMLNVGMGKYYDGVNNASKEISKTVGGYTEELKKLQGMQKKLMDEKVSPLKYVPSGAMGGSASKTSHLAGASGGLGEAKIITIHIGVMQQNNGVKESRDKAAQGVEILTRTLNNIAYGSSSSQ